MTYKKFIDDWYDTVVPDKEPHLRLGQTLMSHLYNTWPAEYFRITNTTVDCFFRDDLIPETIKHLEKFWDRYPN
jgi:hypothetical protein